MSGDLDAQVNVQIESTGEQSRHLRSKCDRILTISVNMFSVSGYRWYIIWQLKYNPKTKAANSSPVFSDFQVVP